MTAAAAMLGFGFMNPALLGGAGLIAVPILIHLLSRRRHWRMSWAATRFLLEAEKKNRRRMRIEQWLLIALRCLAMLLLALIVSRPFVQPGLAAALLGTRGETHRIIVLDDSASLQHNAGGRRDFDTLRETARRLLGWLHDGAAGDAVTFYLTSAPDAPLVERAPLSAATLEDLEKRLAESAPVNERARPRRVMQAAADAWTGGRADVYVLSDFQRTDWAGEDEDGGVFGPLEATGSNAIRTVLIGLNGEARDNAALTGVEFERPHTIAGLPAVLRASVANYTGARFSGGRLTIEAGGEPGPPVELPAIGPGETTTILAEVSFAVEGYATVRAALEAGDGFALDDERLAAVHAARALRVLLANGDPDADAVEDETYFLKSALTPTGPFRSGIEVKVVDPSELGIMRLESFDCVMLCNAAAPGPEAAGALEKYVRGGGGVVFFLGDQIHDSEEYNRIFYKDGEGLLPAALEELVRREAEGSATGAVRTAEHPLTAMLPAAGEASTNRARFYAYFNTEAEEGGEDSRPAKVLARYDDEAGTPALLEREFGRGRSVLFTSSVDLDWNDWPRAADGSYVVTMLETAYYAARAEKFEGAFDAGNTLRVTLSPDDYEAEAVFRAPADTDEPAFEARPMESSASLGDELALEGPIARALGVYTVELAPREGGVETRPMTVNLDPRESDLRAAGEDELAALAGNLSHEYVRASEAFLTGAEKARIELWPGLLALLVVVLTVEQALAWWFGAPGHIEQQRARRERWAAYVKRAWRRRSLFAAGDER